MQTELCKQNLKRLITSCGASLARREFRDHQNHFLFPSNIFSRLIMKIVSLIAQSIKQIAKTSPSVLFVS